MFSPDGPGLTNPLLNRSAMANSTSISSQNSIVRKSHGAVTLNLQLRGYSIRLTKPNHQKFLSVKQNTSGVQRSYNIFQRLASLYFYLDLVSTPAWTWFSIVCRKNLFRYSTDLSMVLDSQLYSRILPCPSEFSPLMFGTMWMVL